MKSKTAAIVFMLFFAHALSAQDQPKDSAPSIKRVVLLSTQFSQTAQFTGIQKDLITQSIFLRINQSNPSYKIIEHSQQNEINTNSSPDALDQIAVLNGADVWLLVRIDGTMGEAQVSYRAHDLHNLTDLFDENTKVEIDSRFRNAFGGLWSPIARSLDSTVKPWQARFKLTLKAAPGTQLHLDNVDESLKEQSFPESGIIELSLPGPASYAYRASGAGAKLNSGNVFLERDAQLDISTQQYFPVFASVSLSRLSYPRFAVAYSLIPDSFELELGFTMYTLALSPATPDAFPNNFVSNYRQLTPDAGVRYWLDKPDRQIRIGLAGALEVNFLTDSSSVINPVVPVALRLGLTGEFKILPELALFADWTPRFGITADATAAISTLAAYGSKNIGLANFSVDLGVIALEPFQFQVGIRVRP